MAGRRTILLVDMNAFYASCHQAIDPSLRGKPVIVAGDPALRHGIVLTASYEAKAYGVKTGMTVGEARAYCPHGVCIRPVYDLYMGFSIRAVNIMRDFSPLVEVFSIDEAFVETTGCEKLFGDGAAIARQIMARVNDELKITCSVGVANSKVVAKTAADLKKPNGLTIITREDIPEKYWPLDVDQMFGVGPRTKKTLNDFFIVKTIGDLAHADIRRLKKRFGKVGEVLWACANGIDDSPVDPHSLDESKSIGHQITLPRDYHRRSEIYTILLELSDEVCRRVRAKGYQGRVIGLTIRGHDLNGIYRTRAIGKYTSVASDVFRTATALFEEHWESYQPVRLLGVALGQLHRIEYVQLEMFTTRNKEQCLAAVVDAIIKRHGAKSLMRATSLTEASLFYESKQTVGGTSHAPARIPHPSFDVRRS